MKKFYFTYQTTNLLNGMIYIGVHGTNNINDNYLGSGLYLRKAINKYGAENFSRKILEFFQDRESAFDAERKLVTKEFISRTDTYNIHIGGVGRKTYYGISDETRMKLSLNSKGRIRITNGIDNFLINERDLEDWIYSGFRVGTNIVLTDEQKELRRKEQSGRKYVTDGTNNKKVRVEELDSYLEKGWKIGITYSKKSKRIRSKNSSNLFKKLKTINNGIKELRVLPEKVDDYICAGWKLGRLKSPNVGKKVLVKDGKRIMIEKSEVQKYIDEGWIYFRNKRIVSDETRKKHQVKGTKYVNKDGVIKRVHPIELIYYLENGWNLGTGLKCPEELKEKYRNLYKGKPKK